MVYLCIMDTELLIKSYKKYIDLLVLPKFPDIMEFEIDYTPETDEYYPKFEFTFLMDGTEYEVEQEIEESIFDMFDYFSEGKNKKRVAFNFKTEL